MVVFRSFLSLIKSLLLIVSVFQGVNGSVLAEPSTKSRSEPWSLCAPCHGQNGMSTMSNIPNLAGQKNRYLKKQYLDFKKGKRTNDQGQMKNMANTVKVKNIDRILVHYSQSSPAWEEKATKRKQMDENTTALLKYGESLYQSGSKKKVSCKFCHSNSGYEAPWLFGQNADYIVKQLQDFQSNRRKNDTWNQMQLVAEQLTEKEMEALGVYLEYTLPSADVFY